MTVKYIPFANTCLQPTLVYSVRIINRQTDSAATRQRIGQTLCRNRIELVKVLNTLNHVKGSLKQRQAKVRQVSVGK